VHRAAHRQWLIHMAQMQRAHHLIFLLLHQVRHISLQLALLLGIVPQWSGWQLTRTPARKDWAIVLLPPTTTARGN
jgi:hypothetical protein